METVRPNVLKATLSVEKQVRSGKKAEMKIHYTEELGEAEMMFHPNLRPDHPSRRR